MDESNNNTISGNTACNNYEQGIYLDHSNNNTIIGNNASGNHDGIYLYFSGNNTIQGNIANDNEDEGIDLNQGCDGNRVLGNIANNNPSEGIQLYSGSDFNIISGNFVSNNNNGIRLNSACRNNTILNNNASNNGRAGIFLNTNSNDNNITENNVNDNIQYGIEISASDFNNIFNNIANDNTDIGIYLRTNCDNNSIYENFFLKNGKHAEDYGTDNKWNSTTIGNFWDDYAGVDANDDGIGDTPYIIPGTAGSQDNFPIWTDGDDIAPVITIIFPLLDSTFGLVAPNYNISIDELNLDTIWYTIDGGGTNYTITGLTGTINQTAWAALPEGNVTITFYANDTAGNVASEDVIITKSLPSVGDDPTIVIVIVVVSIVGGVAGLAGVYIFMKKRAATE